MKALNCSESVTVNGGKLFFRLREETDVCPFSQINKISLLTTRQRLLGDTVFLVFDVVGEAFIMGLSHPQFKTLLLEDLRQLCEIDPSTVVAAVNSSADHEYVLYRKS